MRLKDKVALVTGGVKGIGGEIVRGYVREGAKVVAVYVSSAAGPEMDKELRDGNNGMALKVNIAKREEVDAMVEKIVNELGSIDILVNCAAVYKDVPFMQITEEQWMQTIDVNLNGVFRVTQAVAGVMLKQGSGKIINIASVQALMGVSLMAHYTAAKGGMVSLTRALAAELSPLGINVNCVAPGLTATEHLQELLPPEYLDAIGKTTTIGRMARSDEYVGVCVMLASDDASYITGETIAVDGGMSQIFPPAPPGSGPP